MDVQLTHKEVCNPLNYLLSLARAKCVRRLFTKQCARARATAFDVHLRNLCCQTKVANACTGTMPKATTKKNEKQNQKHENQTETQTGRWWQTPRVCRLCFSHTASSAGIDASRHLREESGDTVREGNESVHANNLPAFNININMYICTYLSVYTLTHVCANIY